MRSGDPRRLQLRRVREHDVGVCNNGPAIDQRSDVAPHDNLADACCHDGVDLDDGSGNDHHLRPEDRRRGARARTGQGGNE